MYLKYTKANTGGKRVFSLRRLFRGEENSPLKIYNTTLSDSGGYCIYHNPPPLSTWNGGSWEVSSLEEILF